MNSHVMTDIETMGTSVDAAIVSIGACSFDITAQDKILDKFSICITLESNQLESRALSAGTISWWLQQSPEAQAQLFKDATNLRSGIKQFRMWMSQLKPVPSRIWANSPSFDIAILRHAFNQLGEYWPSNLGFWTERDVRTICELAYPNPDELKEMQGFYRRQGTHHSALDDAIAQAKIVQHCYLQLQPCSMSIYE